jgi:hypothetical protein
MIWLILATFSFTSHTDTCWEAGKERERFLNEGGTGSEEMERGGRREREKGTKMDRVRKLRTSKYQCGGGREGGGKGPKQQFQIGLTTAAEVGKHPD